MATYSTDASIDLPESPCIKLCTLNDEDVCVGCYRNIDEICAWSTASPQQRRAILEASEQRRKGNEGRA